MVLPTFIHLLPITGIKNSSAQGRWSCFHVIKSSDNSFKNEFRLPALHFICGYEINSVPWNFSRCQSKKAAFFKLGDQFKLAWVLTYINYLTFSASV